MLQRLLSDVNKRIVWFVNRIVWIGDYMNPATVAFDRLVEVAAKVGKNPTELAAAIGVSPQCLFNWKRRGVPPGHVRGLVKALGGALLAHEIRPDLPEIFPHPDAETLSPKLEPAKAA